MFVYDEENGDNWSGFYGSKPELKHQIKRVFNTFRAVENLLFAVKAEFARIKTIVLQPNEADFNV